MIGLRTGKPRSGGLGFWPVTSALQSWTDGVTLFYVLYSLDIGAGRIRTTPHGAHPV